MRDFLFIMLLAATCCVVFSQEVEAQDINTYTEVSYYAPTNSMHAFVQVTPEYSSESYYCVDVTAYVFKDDVEQTNIYAKNDYYGDNYYTCSGPAIAETFLPYDPNADYSIEAYPGVEVRTRFDESGIGGYYDVYNFMEWSEGDLVYYPTHFSFMGTGPETRSPVGIILGTVFSIFT